VLERFADDYPFASFLSEAGDVDAPHGLNGPERGDIGPNGKPSLTIQEAAAQITRDDDPWSSNGVTTTVSYAFRATAPTDLPDDTSGFSRFSGVQIAAAELALLAWSDVAAITFLRQGSGAMGEAAYSDDAAILFANYSDGDAGAAAFAYFPGSRGANALAGDVWVDNTLDYNARPIVFDYGQHVLVHELGHAIGLNHPGDYDAVNGEPITYSRSAEYYEDSEQYSVMSYFSADNTGASDDGIYGSAPLLDDIAAAQRLYGPNNQAFLGDTIYGFHSNTGRPWFSLLGSDRAVFAIWDAGGRDTLDFSGYDVRQTIDLREGYFSSVGGLIGNVAIAAAVVVENAIGGLNADMINGNGVANSLSGLAGDDVLTGGLGGDALDGGAGFDYASYAGAATGVTVFLGGPYLNAGEAAGDSYAAIEGVIGSAHADLIGGTNGGDALQGGDGNDWLLGAGGDDWLVGATGNDLLEGGSGHDVMDGGSGDDVASYRQAAAGVTAYMSNYLANVGEAFGDQYTAIENLWGSDFADTLGGTDAAGQVYGFGGTDTLYGYGGDDNLYGGDAIDTLSGGTGADTFFFLLQNEGGDTITDFVSGQDRVFFSEYWFGLPIAPAGSISASRFVSGDHPAAAGPGASFLFDTASHQLLFDPDGSGAQAAILMATFNNGVNLTAGDIWGA
jgi:serralysin